MSSRLPETMRAARYPTYGESAGSIRVDTVPRPDPAPGEVLVEIAVSGVNPTDWKARTQTPNGSPAWMIPNHDGAGTVVAVGDRVSTSRIGERVWLWQAAWQRSGGSAAQYVALPSAKAVRLPDAASFDVGAGLGIPAMTAHYCLFEDGELGESDRVLVQGGAGAVGQAAIALARHAGARVAATVSGPEKGDIAAQAGAELVVDYRRDAVAQRVREWAPDGVSRVVEVDLAANLDTDAAVIAPHGTIAVYARTTSPVSPAWELMVANARIRFVLVYTIPERAKEAAVHGITDALEAGALHSLPITRFPLEQASDAHDAVQRGVFGKVLIDVAAT